MLVLRTESRDHAGLSLWRSLRLALIFGALGLLPACSANTDQPPAPDKLGGLADAVTTREFKAALPAVWDCKRTATVDPTNVSAAACAGDFSLQTLQLWQTPEAADKASAELAPLFCTFRAGQVTVTASSTNEEPLFLVDEMAAIRETLGDLEEVHNSCASWTQ